MSDSLNGRPKGVDDALNDGRTLTTVSGREGEEFLKKVEDAALKDAVRPVDLDDADIWTEEIIPLPEEIAVSDLNVDMLPEGIRTYCVVQSTNLQVMLSFVALPLISAFGSIIGSAIRIKPKVHADWILCPNFWYMLVGPPSVKKSPADGAGSIGLDHVSRTEEEKYQTEITAWRPFEEQLLAKKKGILEKITRSAAGKKKSTEPPGEELQTELSKIQEELNLRPRQYVIATNDATIEKLAELQAVNRNGIAIKRDEIHGLIEKLDGNDSKGDRHFYIEGFEGGRRYRVHRLTRDAATVTSHTLSMGGTTQPGPLKALVKNSSGLSKKNDGLIQRFSMLVVQLAPQEPKYVDEPVDHHDRQRLEQASQRVRDWVVEILRTEECGFLQAVFSSDAQREFVRIFEDQQKRMHAAVECPDLQAHLGKYPKLIPSLALVFSLIRSAYRGDQKPPLEISVADLLMAEQWSIVLETHAQWLYDGFEDQLPKGARALAEKIESGEVADGSTLRSIYRHGWTHLKNEKALAEAIDSLTQLGWCVTEHRKGAKGAPAMILRIHPDLQ